MQCFLLLLVEGIFSFSEFHQSTLDYKVYQISIFDNYHMYVKHV